jgi:hypothetical protein
MKLNIGALSFFDTLNEHVNLKLYLISIKLNLKQVNFGFVQKYSLILRQIAKNNLN